MITEIEEVGVRRRRTGGNRRPVLQVIVTCRDATLRIGDPQADAWSSAVECAIRPTVKPSGSDDGNRPGR